MGVFRLDPLDFFTNADHPHSLSPLFPNSYMLGYQGEQREKQVKGLALSVTVLDPPPPWQGEEKACLTVYLGGKETLCLLERANGG